MIAPSGAKYLISQLSNNLISKYPHPVIKYLLPVATTGIINIATSKNTKKKTLGLFYKTFKWIKNQTEISSEEELILIKSKLESSVENGLSTILERPLLNISEKNKD
ncbi:hypothetical protein EGI22_13525 [Lacihabitans sp. LS3-19]|uniref:hypothetical protein n=1 Tax=Lacihabitans sp. LS3-19 TaxID=2487335 RepID=UPI0020CBCDC7|nr:hypothetical protein [Lacihabitans sp. LS3-19]MCP9768934.1 hypothetical protein [Lacihabitans sp. LS3-19]